MKKIILALLGMLSFGIANSQTEGTLTVTATTSSTGGNFAPKNIVAIWIEDEQGDWVKTLLAYAATRKTYLNTWEATTTAAGSPFNVVDAITGATQPNHGTRSCSWNGTDVNGVVVADGNYKVWMELTDKNGTGNFSSFSFTKDTIPLSLTPANVPSFSSISIVWEPVVVTSVKENPVDKYFQVFPNPSAGIFSVNGDDISKVEVINLAGNMIFECKSLIIDITDQPAGIYYVRITSDKGLAFKKVIKNE